MQSRSKLLPLVESAVLIALSFVLMQITLFKLPQGGSVTAGSMIPILLIGLRHGPRWGVMSGVVFGLLQAMTATEPAVHWAQWLIDYPVAFGVLGLAGFARGRNPYAAGALSSLALIGHFLAHLVSGVIFFGEYAPAGQNVWVYSAIYNGSYMLPEMLISAAILLVLHPALRRALPPAQERAV